MDTTITTLEMCAGYGGIGLGLKNIFGERLRTIAYCELEGFAQANLISKMEKGLLDAAPIWSDLKTFPYESFHGLVDILIAGYPCQPFSAAGKRAGKDDSRHLWPWIADGIRILRPGMCFFENVEGHISLGLSSVISDLEELGYKVSWGIFSASEVGAPHQRKRVFILACDQSVGIQGCGAGWLQEPRPHAGQALPVRSGDAGGGELANAGRIEPQGWNGVADGQQSGAGRIPWCEFAPRHDQVWPSRPGEQQYGWEPPRVVGSRLANPDQLRLEEHGLQYAGVSVGSGGGQDAEAVGNATEWQDNGRESRDLGQAAGEGRCGDDAADGAGEVLADTSIVRCDGRPNGISGRIWEPGEVSEDATGCGGEGNGMRQTQPALGRDADGPAGGLGYAELCVSCDNRTDELRLLGNGVVPATAERAFLTLIKELNT